MDDPASPLQVRCAAKERVSLGPDFFERAGFVDFAIQSYFDSLSPFELVILNMRIRHGNIALHFSMLDS